MARSTLLAALVLALPVAAQGAVQITTAHLPPATVGQPYQVALDAQGGDSSTYFWVLPGLPPGLELQNGTNAKIAGVPTVYGTYQLTVSVTDTNGDGDHVPLNLEVKTSTSPLPEALRGEPYAGSVAVQGGMPPVSYTLASGALPEHLTLADSGAITGTVAATEALGMHTFLVLAKDAVNHTASLPVSIDVVDPPPPHAIVDPVPKGGCSSAGGASWLGLLATLGWRRRRFRA